MDAFIEHFPSLLINQSTLHYPPAFIHSHTHSNTNSKSVYKAATCSSGTHAHTNWTSIWSKLVFTILRKNTLTTDWMEPSELRWFVRWPAQSPELQLTQRLFILLFHNLRYIYHILRPSNVWIKCDSSPSGVTQGHTSDETLESS